MAPRVFQVVNSGSSPDYPEADPPPSSSELK